MHFFSPTRRGERIREQLRPGEEARDDYRPERGLVQEDFRRKRADVRIRQRTGNCGPFCSQERVPHVLEWTVEGQVEQRLSRRSRVIVFLTKTVARVLLFSLVLVLQSLRDAIADDA